jgi:hypothetical protein
MLWITLLNQIIKVTAPNHQAEGWMSGFPDIQTGDWAA